MKSSTPIEILEVHQSDIVPSDPRLRAAAELLLTEVYLGVAPTASQIDETLSDPPEGMLYYIAVQEGSQLVGAASVHHTKAKTTFIEGIAVTKTERRQGYAMQLMGRIAQAAILHASAYIELVPVNRKPAKKFFASLGFTEYQSGVHAAPQDVLQRTTSH